MAADRAADVLLVSLGATEGLRRADDELADSLRRAGASVHLARAAAPTERPTLMLTDLAWAGAARTSALHALKELRGSPGAVIYSSTTAALLWPRPGAIRFDAPSSGNRPGRHGLWQRPLERRRLAAAPLLLPWSEGALRESPPAARTAERAIVVPVPAEPSGGGHPGERDIAALTYGANPLKKGLDRVLAAWRQVRAEGTGGPDQELVVTGASLHELQRAGLRLASEEGVRVLDGLTGEAYRALVRRARVFVCAPRREDYGLAQLEALADGCMLVTTPAPGPYAALPIARALDPRLVSDDLAGALRTALVEPLPDYGERAGEALAPFSRREVDRVVAERLLPRLLP
ncbi:MAG TPA: glycosyltransferase [Solirubrobacteraceae bacterium]|nr:glycosyltransferase [Solirubrobacteraceae bacterium]